MLSAVAAATNRSTCTPKRLRWDPHGTSTDIGVRGLAMSPARDAELERGFAPYTAERHALRGWLIQSRLTRLPEHPDAAQRTN